MGRVSCVEPELRWCRCTKLPSQPGLECYAFSFHTGTGSGEQVQRGLVAAKLDSDVLQYPVGLCLNGDQCLLAQ